VVDISILTYIITIKKLARADRLSVLCKVWQDLSHYQHCMGCQYRIEGLKFYRVTTPFQLDQGFLVHPNAVACKQWYSNKFSISIWSIFQSADQSLFQSAIHSMFFVNYSHLLLRSQSHQYILPAISTSITHERVSLTECSMLAFTEFDNIAFLYFYTSFMYKFNC